MSTLPGRQGFRKRPKGCGDKPDTYNSDAIFLIGIDAPTAYKSMTIRNWTTTMALLERMEAAEADA